MRNSNRSDNEELSELGSSMEYFVTALLFYPILVFGTFLVLVTYLLAPLILAWRYAIRPVLIRIGYTKPELSIEP